MRACVCVIERGCVIYDGIRYKCIPTKILNVLLIELLYPVKERKKKIETKEINKQNKQREKQRKTEKRMQKWKSERNGGRKKGK